MSSSSIKTIGNNKIEPTFDARQTRPINNAIPAFIVTILFNHVCGFLALYFNASAKQSWRKNDHKKSKQYCRYSSILLIIGILLGIATYAVAFSLYFVVFQKDTTSLTSHSSTSGDRNVYASECCWPASSFVNYNYETNFEAKAIDYNNDQALYCVTSGDDTPVYADPNGKYGDCCVSAGCHVLGG